MEIEQATTQEVFEPTIEDMIQTESGIPTTTSLVIAQVFDKEHKNVLRDIQNLECSPQFRQLNFELYEYSKDLDIGVRKYPAYRLTRDGFVFLAMGFIHPEQEGLIKELSIAVDTRGNIAVDPGTNRIADTNIFASGDAVSGASLVVRAMASGRKAAAAIDKYLHPHKS